MKHKQKSLRQIARELGVSASYLSQIRHGQRHASKKVLSRLDVKMLSSVNQKAGGSVWGSNPPKTLSMPPDGFEVREAHRDSNAPLNMVHTGICQVSRLTQLT
jgi:transcriptional regulator with XRE-family HTH domain